MNVVLIGDSTAAALNDGLTAWAAEATNRREVSVASIGCGLIRNTLMLGDENGNFTKQCGKALDKNLPQAIAAGQVDTAMIMVTIPDVVKHQWSTDEGLLRWDDARYTERMLDDYRTMADTLIADGVRHIVWIVPPIPADWWLGWQAEDEYYTPETWSGLRAVLATVQREHPDVVEVTRLDEWFESSGASVDPAMRDDGLHLTEVGAMRVMDEFLGPVLLRLSAV